MQSDILGSVWDIYENHGYKLGTNEVQKLNFLGTPARISFVDNVVFPV